MNERLLAILQIAVAAIRIADPQSQAAEFAKIGANALAAYKEITGKPVDPELIKEYERIE